MSFGKSSSTTTPTLSPEQKAQIAAQTDFFTNTIKPTYQNAVNGAGNVYNQIAPGLLNAAQNLSGTAGQAQNVLGTTGESALRSGISGLENILSPDYGKGWADYAVLPAQQAYATNLAAQQAMYGGSGQIGSARDALAKRQLALGEMTAEGQLRNQVGQQIAQQQQSAANQLAGYGQGGIGQALGAAGQRVSAAMTPQQLYNQYASVIFGTPASSYTPDFRGTQATTTSGNKSGLDFQGIKIG